jgi:hypothetical protein
MSFKMILIIVVWDTPEDGGWNEHYTSAPDTEDENDFVSGLRHGQRPLIKQSDHGQTNKALAKSYAKLEKAVPLGHKPEMWHDWFEMQADWMKNVEKDPEHYFDDYL